VQRLTRQVAAALLLGGPTVLAFFAGGYFTQPRLVAAIAAWVAVLALALSGPAPLPRRLPGRLALAGLVLLTLWTAASIAWAPVHGPAVQNVQRLVLYTGTLLVAVGALRDERARAAVEPALAAGATLVIAYGLSGRLLPGLIALERSESAGGRLEQPLTYWNAEGTLAAMGLVLCARLAGDRRRPPALRALAAAASVPLGAGVYLSFSRGAIAVAVLGLVILVAAAPSRAQLRAAAGAGLAGAAAAVAVGAFRGTAALEGALSDRERAGAIVLALLVLLAAAAGLLALRRIRSGSEEGPAPGWTRRLPAVAVAGVALVAAGLIAGGLAERPSASELAAGAGLKRLGTVSSNRYEYWRVGARAFAEHPLAGFGAGGFRTFWLQERKITETVKDTHSLPVEVAAELGLAGLLALGLLLAGAGLAARDALRRAPPAAAGPLAAVVAWLLHASIDWDWEMPAVTLPALALTGALIVLGEATGAPRAPRADRAAAGRPAPAAR
jgi:hypothetical protein